MIFLLSLPLAFVKRGALYDPTRARPEGGQGGGRGEGVQVGGWGERKRKERERERERQRQRDEREGGKRYIFAYRPFSDRRVQLSTTDIFCQKMEIFYY
jgi:hypothetical protein